MPTLTAKRIVTYGSIILFSIGLLFYIYTQSITYLSGPQIRIDTPIDYSTTDNELAHITGKVTNVSFVFLNDKPIFATVDGMINEKLLLDLGYNIIELRVIDRFERSRQKHIHVTYIPSKPPLYAEQIELRTPSTDDDNILLTSTSTVDTHNE